MDQRLQYEQLIRAKLQGLTIPDMEDMIWARVKAMLDIDMPTDDNDGSDNGPQDPIAGGPLTWALSVVVVALLTAFIFLKTKPTITQIPPSAPVITQPANEPTNQPTGPPAGNTMSTTAPLISPETTTPGARSIDSSFLQDGVNVPTTSTPNSARPDKPDSVFTQVLPPLVPIDTTTVPAKKGKGVSGLNDKDYRIVPRNKE